MIELRLLGLFAARSPPADGRPRTFRIAPREAALLAYLALSKQPGRRTRDQLVGIFWPELPESRARAALSQSVYRIRSVLGRNTLVSAGDDEVALAVETIRCDAVEFVALLEQGRIEPALELYRGDLLTGFHLTSAPDFEQWLEPERSRLRALAAKGAAELATQLEEAGDVAGAAGRLRDALGWSPWEEPLVRERVRVLARLGDRSGVVREYESFVRRLEEDLGLEPSAGLRRFVDELRGPAGSVEESRHGAAVVSLVGNGTVEAGPRPVPVDPPPPAPAGGRRRTARSLYVLSVTAAALVVGAVALFDSTRRTASDTTAAEADPARELRPDRVIVVPLDSPDDEQLRTAGWMAADWIGQRLQRSGLVEVIDPRSAFRLMEGPNPEVSTSADRMPQLMRVAEAARAGTVVWGSVYRRGDRIALRVHIADIRDGAVLSTLEPVEAGWPELGPVLETLAARVAGALATVVDARFAAVTAPSSPPPTFEAYQAYSRGLDRFDEQDWRGALPLFDEAARLDSTFVLARFWASHALRNSGQFSRGDSAIAALLALRERLPPAEKAALEGMAAEIDRDWERALQGFRRAARLAPQSQWPYMAAATANGLDRHREALADLAVLDPTSGWVQRWPWYWLTQLNALHVLREYEHELEVARVAHRYFPRVNFTVRPLAALGRVTEINAYLDSLESSLAHDSDTPCAPGVLAVSAEIACTRRLAAAYTAAATELRDHGHGDRTARYLSRCAELYAEAPNPDVADAEIVCHYAAGNWSVALAWVEAKRTQARQDGIPYEWDGWWGVVAARLGRTEAAEEFMRTLLDRSWPGRDPTRLLTFQARIAVLLGKREAALDYLRQIDRPGHLRQTLQHEPDFAPLHDDPFVARFLRPRLE